MRVIDRLVEIVAEDFPGRKFTISDHMIRVEAPDSNGFSVWLSAKDGHYTVGFDGWHEHIDSMEEAVKCFEFGLNGRCRLKVEWCGTFPYRWTVEYPSEAGWTEYSVTGLLLFPFWRQRHLTYLRNQAAGA